MPLHPSGLPAYKKNGLEHGPQNIHSSTLPSISENDESEDEDLDMDEGALEDEELEEDDPDDNDDDDDDDQDDDEEDEDGDQNEEEIDKEHCPDDEDKTADHRHDDHPKRDRGKRSGGAAVTGADDVNRNDERRPSSTGSETHATNEEENNDDEEKDDDRSTVILAAENGSALKTKEKLAQKPRTKGPHRRLVDRSNKRRRGPPYANACDEEADNLSLNNCPASVRSMLPKSLSTRSEPSKTEMTTRPARCVRYHDDSCTTGVRPNFARNRLTMANRSTGSSGGGGGGIGGYPSYRPLTAGGLPLEPANFGTGAMKKATAHSQSYHHQHTNSGGAQTITSVAARRRATFSRSRTQSSSVGSQPTSETTWSDSELQMQQSVQRMDNQLQMIAGEVDRVSRDLKLTVNLLKQLCQSGLLGSIAAAAKSSGSSATVPRTKTGILKNSQVGRLGEQSSNSSQSLVEFGLSQPTKLNRIKSLSMRKACSQSTLNLQLKGSTASTANGVASTCATESVATSQNTKQNAVSAGNSPCSSQSTAAAATTTTSGTTHFLSATSSATVIQFPEAKTTAQTSPTVVGPSLGNHCTSESAEPRETPSCTIEIDSSRVLEL